MEQSNKQLSVILLKTSDQTSDVKDRYVSFLTNNDERKQFSLIEQINLLSIEQINILEFSEKLFNLFFRKSEEEFYRCLILTSRQTVDSFASAILHFQNSHLTDFNSNRFVVYCVGEQTAKKFKETLNKLKKPDLNLILNDDLIEIKVCEAEKQNALELSKLIINDFNNDRNKESGLYALYPCSSIRKDDLSVELEKNKIPFDEINVYKTGYSSDGVEQLDGLVQRLKDSANTIICLVFFSPSGVDAVFKDISRTKFILNNKDLFTIISVGLSTTTKLKVYLNNFDIYQMNQPAPQALLDILKRF